MENRVSNVLSPNTVIWNNKCTLILKSHRLVKADISLTKIDGALPWECLPLSDNYLLNYIPNQKS